MIQGSSRRAGRLAIDTERNEGAKLKHLAGTHATTLQPVRVKQKALSDYEEVAEGALLDECRTLGADLRSLRVLHINSTASGGGVAELLNSLVPLEVDCGIQAEWRLLCPDDALFAVTKGFHNGLQGQVTKLNRDDQEIFIDHNHHCAAMLGSEYDVVIIHDPQPAAIPAFAHLDGARFVWRCHVDSSQPAPAVWDFLRPYVNGYDAAVFTMEQFVPPGLSGPTLSFIPPAIDPLAPKNRELPTFLCREEVAEFGIDLSRPLMLQVARFDPWKDPIGVIEAYRLVKQSMPSVQLALIGSMASDDPEGWEMYEKVRSAAGGDDDIHIFTNLTGVGAHEVNAFQRVADVVVQKSIREGFGLVVAEALWKGTPVVAGNTGGIPLQLQDGVGGFLVDTVEECAERTLHLLLHSGEAEEIAEAGRHVVREKFLIPRLLRDELNLLRSLSWNG